MYNCMTTTDVVSTASVIRQSIVLHCFDIFQFGSGLMFDVLCFTNILKNWFDVDIVDCLILCASPEDSYQLFKNNKFKNSKSNCY